MSEHTKESWALEAGADQWEICDERATRILATVDYYEGAEEVARLIAAAPDLLAGLTGILYLANYAIEHGKLSDRAKAYASSRVNVAVAAHNKAYGGSAFAVEFARNEAELMRAALAAASPEAAQGGESDGSGV